MRDEDTSAMRREYDFSRGVRGKHHDAYRRGANTVRVKTCATVLPDDPATSKHGRTSRGPGRLVPKRPPGR